MLRALQSMAVVIGCFLTTVCEIMQQVLKGVERWCMDRALRQS